MDRTGTGAGSGSTSGTAASIFPKGPSFTLDDFSSKDFIVRDFIDSLIESAVPASRRSGPSQAAFDPKPLIRTFESKKCPPTTLSEGDASASSEGE